MPVSIGDIVFGLGPDTSRLRRAVRDITDFGDALDKMAASTEDGANKAAAAMQKQEAATTSALQKMLNFNQQVRSAGSAPASIIGTSHLAFKQLSEEMTKGTLTSLEYQRAQEANAAMMGRATRGFAQYKTELAEGAARNAEYVRNINQTNAALLRQDAILSSAMQKMMNFNQRVGATKGAPQEPLVVSQQAMGNLQNALSGGAKSPQEMAKATQAFNAEMGRASRILKDYKAGIDVAKDSSTGFTDKLHQMAIAAQLTTGPLSGVAFRITTLSNLLAQGGFATALWVAGLAGAGYAAIKFSEGIVHNEEKLLRMRLQLLALSGSMDQVKSDMNFTLEVANKFGVSFQEVAQHFARIELAARGSAIEGRGVRDMFKDLIAYSANFGLTNEKTTAILNIFEHILSRGNIQMRELRSQLSSQIPNAPVLMAQALAGGDEAKLDRMVKRGEVMADVALPKLVKAILQMGNVDSSKPVDNLFASQGRLNTAIQQFLQALDQTLGISDAYKASLDRGTSAIDFFRGAIEKTIAMIGAFGIAVTVAFAFPSIISGFALATRAIIAFGTAILSVGAAIAGGGIAAGIRSITTAVTTLSLVSLASPIGWLLRIGAAVGAAVVGYELLNSALERNSGKSKDAADDAEDYLKSLRDQKKAISEVTAEKIKALSVQATIDEVALTKSKAAMEEAQKKLKSASDEAAVVTGKSWWQNFLEGFIANSQTLSVGGRIENTDIADRLVGSKEIIKSAETTASRAVEEFNKRWGAMTRQRTLIQDLNVELQKQQDIENQPKKGREQDENERAKRMRLATEELERTVSEQNKEFEAMKKGPAELQKAMEEIQLEKTVEGWRKKLEQAGFTAAEAAPKIEKLAQSAKQLADMKLADKNFVSWAKFLEEGFAELGKVGVGKFVDAVNAGTLSMKTLRDIGFSVITTLEKKFLELAFVNPLMNMMFGSTSPVFTFGMPGSRPGGLLGGAIGGSASSTGPISTLHGGSATSAWRLGVSSSIFANAPRLHDGLMPDEFPSILQRGEQVIPRGGSTQAPVTFHAESHIHYDGPPSDDPMKQQQVADASRRSLETMMDHRIAEAMRPGGPIWRGRH